MMEITKFIQVNTILMKFTQKEIITSYFIAMSIIGFLALIIIAAFTFCLMMMSLNDKPNEFGKKAINKFQNHEKIT
jgi:uncharacterized membrane protein YhaH (DUF805 family)